MFKWRFLGQGSYNIAFINDYETQVFKYPLSKSNSLNTPERSVRVWNEIYNHPIYQAYLYHDQNLGHGWIAPYIEGESATDSQIARELLHIYQNTGRVVVDAPSEKNFISQENGETLCVDVGMALKLGRSPSVCSIEAWRIEQHKYSPYWDIHQPIVPETIDTIKALLWIQNHRPDIIDVMFLKHMPQLIKKIANAYDIIIYQTEVFNELIRHKPLHFDQVKQQIRHHLMDYISSRGSCEHGQFVPNRVSQWLRNTELTKLKVYHVFQLIDGIKKANTIEDLNTHLERVRHLPCNHQHSLFSKSKLDNCLDQCLNLTLSIKK